MTTGDEVERAHADGEAARPTLRVVRGEPAPEELAALAAVLAGVNRADAAAHTDAAHRPRMTGAWATSTRGGRRMLRPGPGAWAVSARG